MKTKVKILDDEYMILLYTGEKVKMTPHLMNLAEVVEDLRIPEKKSKPVAKKPAAKLPAEVDVVPVDVDKDGIPDWYMVRPKKDEE